MKRTLLLLVLLTSSFCASSQTNVYHPFPDTNAIWNVAYNELRPGCCGFSVNYYDRSYIQQGDTIINSVRYNKVRKIEHHTESWFDMNCSCNIDHGFSNSIIGGLRNDSANKKVYFYSIQAGLEYLLYNFNIGIGDSVAWRDPNSGSVFFYKHITAVDSILIGTSYHKRFKHDGAIQMNPYFVEGVGSLDGLLEPFDFFENGSTLVCYSVNGVIKYQNNGFGCGIVGSSEYHSNSIQTELYPNPSLGSFTLKSNEKMSYYEIVDVFGNLITKNFTDLMQVNIDLRNLASGIYFVKIHSSNGGQTVKKIILE